MKHITKHAIRCYLDSLAEYAEKVGAYQKRNCLNCYLDRMHMGLDHYCSMGEAAFCMAINGDDFTYKKKFDAEIEKNVD